MADVTDNPGALTGLTLDDEEKSEKPVVYGVYQTEAQTPDANQLTNLQSIYGTQAMPVFEWVKSIQTGTRQYNPADPVDQELLQKYNDLVEEQGKPPGMMSAEEIAKAVVVGTAGQLGQAAATQMGAALFDPYYEAAGKSTGGKLLAGAGETFGSTPSQLVSETRSTAFDNIGDLKTDQTIYPELANREVAEATGNLDLYNSLEGKGTKLGDNITSYKSSDVDTAVGSEQVSSNLTAEAITTSSQTPSYFSEVGDRLYGTEAAKANWAGAAGAGLVNFGVQLAMGEDPEKAAKSAGASAIGTAIGNALLPGLGGVVGGVLGGVLGGRVICNELCRQGVMTRKQVVLDYKFTRDYLTPQHVNGYHVWAVWMVRQMRKGKFVKFWKHVAGHRANEIAYIYGEREKPDYLGKVYRKILEPTCWVVGYFCKRTDWSTLYNTKEV